METPRQTPINTPDNSLGGARSGESVGQKRPLDVDAPGNRDVVMGRIQMGKKLCHGPSDRGMEHRASNLGRWLQNETPPRHSWMRKHERRRPPQFLAVEQQIEINQAGTPGFGTPSPQLVFDPLKDRQYSLGGKRRLKRHRAVQKGGLANRPADGRGLAKSARLEKANARLFREQPSDAFEGLATVAQIGAQGNQARGHRWVPIRWGLS